MKNILNEELNRIQYLFNHKRGVVISEQAEIRQGPKGDPYQYKKEDGRYFYAKKTDGKPAESAFFWTEQKNQKGIDAIKTKIFDNPALAPTTTTTTTTTTVPDVATATGINVQTTFDQLATGKDKMNNQPFNTFAYFVKMAPGADPSLPNTGKVDGVASPLKLEDFKTKYPDYASYRYVPTPEGGFKAGIDVESGAVYGKETVNKDKEVSGQEQMDKAKEEQAQTDQVDNETMIQEWCDSNEILADEECYPVSGMDYNQARKQASVDATKAKHPYKRDEFWDEATKTFIAIYGFRSRSKKELKKRNESKPAGQSPSPEQPAQPEQPVTPPQGRDMKTPMDVELGDVA